MKKWDWLRDHMHEHNISQQQAADALLWKKPRISELLCSKRDLPVSKVFLAAKFFNLDLEELTKYNSGFSDKIPQIAGKSMVAHTDKNIVCVDVIDAQHNSFFSPLAKWPLDIKLLKNLGLPSANNIKIIIAHGDAMSPTINDRDIVAIDTTVHLPQHDGMYLFKVKDELFIKRICLNQFDGTADIISDNHLYPKITVTNFNKITCLGKVIAVSKLYI